MHLFRFVKAAAEINDGKATAADFDIDLPTGQHIIGGPLIKLSKSDENHTEFEAADFHCSSVDFPGRVTEAVTAILEAGRRSLDNDGATVKILYESEDWQKITDLKVVA